MQGRSDYRLIDLRAASDFAAYHIPTAENVTVAALPEFPFLRNEKIVLYSDGGIHAAQAWMLMQAQGYRAVYTVLGGLEGWKDEVLYPALPAQASAAERARFERAAALSRFFGGEPRAEGGGGGPGTHGAAQAGGAGALGRRVPGRAAQEKERGLLRQ